MLQYKEEGSAPFKDVTRSVLFEEAELGYQWRYFEVGAGGHTTLERHEHVHAVMILRGGGRRWSERRSIRFTSSISFVSRR